MPESKKGYTDSNIPRMQGFLDSIHSQLDSSQPPSFATLEISINGACTRRCTFCPRVDESYYPNDLLSLDICEFKHVINSLAANNFLGRISFSGFVSLF